MTPQILQRTYSWSGPILATSMAVVCLFAAPTAAADVRAIVLGPGSDNTIGWESDLQSKLLGTGAFATVDFIDMTRMPLPSLPDLQTYDSVLVFPISPIFFDLELLGDILADYVDAGGGVVEEPPETLEVAGKGEDGNRFSHSGGAWSLKLKTKGFSGPATYVARAVSGDPASYTIGPTCNARFFVRR